MAESRSYRTEFMACYGPLSDRLGRYARALTRDAEEARDLLSETTLQAYESFLSLHDRTAFPSWVFTIMTRIERKKGIRAKYHEPMVPEIIDELRSPVPAPSTTADNRLLYDAIRRLPKEQAEAVTLFEIVDLPLAEVARIQGVSLSGAKSRVTRGRARLARLLGVDDEAEPAEREPERGRSSQDPSQRSNDLLMSTT